MESNFWYEIINEYYVLALYTASDLDIFIEGNMITADEKAKIIDTIS